MWVEMKIKNWGRDEAVSLRILERKENCVEQIGVILVRAHRLVLGHNKEI